MDPLAAVKWFNTALFGTNIVLAGLLIRRLTGGFLWASVFGSFLVATSVDTLGVHSMAGTEGLFILFLLLGLLALAEYVDTDRGLHLLLISASAVGLASLTKYAGLALVLAGSASVLLLTRAPLRSRLASSALYAVAGSLPLALWLARNLLVAGNATGAGRNLGFHPVTLAHLRDGVVTFAGWVLPIADSGTVASLGTLAMFSGLVGVALLAVRRSRGLQGTRLVSESVRNNRSTVLVLAIALSQLAFLVISISFADLSLSFEKRLLAPAYVCLLVTAVSSAYHLVRVASGAWLKAYLLGICGAVAAVYLIGGTAWVARSYDNGRFYASRDWHQSELIRWIKDRPEGTIIYTNGADAVYLLAGRIAVSVPRETDPFTRQPNPGYIAELKELKQRMDGPNAFLVYFRAIGWRSYLPSEDELKGQLQLRLVESKPDGAIYVSPQTTWLNQSPGN